MNDKPDNGAGTTQQAALTANGQYIKDLSFEAPHSPGILTELQNQQPEVNVNINVLTSQVQGEGVPDNVHEVVLELQAEMKLGDRTAFLVELKYGGIFTLNVADEHKETVLLIECPRLMFPFARQIISDATQGGGFMPLLLQPVDFGMLYQARAQQTVSELSDEVEQMAKDKQN